MTIEAFRSTSRSNYLRYPHVLYDYATFFNSSVNFVVIDSYSSITGRYKGDPIADSIWDDADDISEDNSWIIIQCNTYLTSKHATLPRWQMKIQIANTSTFADVSDPTGVEYPEWHGETRVICGRFSPYGSWDLENTEPDFSPANGKGSFENKDMYLDLSRNGHRWYLVAGEGWFYTFNRTLHGGSPGYFSIESLGCFVGDFWPVDENYQPMPRCIIANNGDSFDPKSLADGGGHHLLCEGLYECSYTGIEFDHDPGIGYEDHNGDFVEKSYTITTERVIYYKTACLNIPGSRKGVDILPYVVCPREADDNFRALGEIPAFGRMRGMTTGLFDDRNWLCTSARDDRTTAFRWDGVSNLM